MILDGMKSPTSRTGDSIVSKKQSSEVTQTREACAAFLRLDLRTYVADLSRYVIFKNCWTKVHLCLAELYPETLVVAVAWSDHGQH